MAFQYAAKFICGLAREDNLPVAMGRYSTVVNVHNPQEEKEVEFRYKLAVAAPGENGGVSEYQFLIIKPDHAIYFDCNSVRKAFRIPDELIDGFLVIESKEYPLDVVAAYTTADLSLKGVPAIAVERVFERQIG